MVERDEEYKQLEKRVNVDSEILNLGETKFGGRNLIRHET